MTTRSGIVRPDSESESHTEGPRLAQRRTFLRYVGVGVSSLAMGWLPTSCARPPRGPRTPERSPSLDVLGLDFLPPAYPVPLPGGGGPGDQNLESFAVLDELVLPPGIEWRVVTAWGDRLGTDGHEVLVGNNADYTGLLPMDEGGRDHWLFVNHEYVSPRPWLDAYPDVYGSAAPNVRLLEDENQSRGILAIDDWRSTDHSLDLDDSQAPDAVVAQARALAETLLSEMGVSVLHVRRLDDGHFEVVSDSTRHRRISTAHRQNIEAEHAPVLTGPATAILGRDAIGTMCNCSGGTTPWGTFLTCEENIQNQVTEPVGPSGESLAARRRLTLVAATTGGKRSFANPRPSMIDGSGLIAFEDPLDGRKYGWIAEIDPATGALRKHTALGRFRHENITLRVEAGQPLAAYMGDDRRGGHVWKFVSDDVVERADDPGNSELMTRGTLYAAKFGDDWGGTWLPLQPETPLVRPTPERCVGGFLNLPDRESGGTVRVGTDELAANSRTKMMTSLEWCRSIEDWAGLPFEKCTLEHLVAPELRSDRQKTQAVLLLDAFAMANAIGATPTARPEDLEVHPLDSSVFIAFTDATGGSDGSPDSDVFPDSRRENSRQYGALYRLVDEIAGTQFNWGRFLTSGDAFENGGGFACADNLAFDPEANLWMVTDISTSALNFPVRQDDEATAAGTPAYRGVFGNNSLFRIPTSGPESGMPKPFAIGPVDSELTGPTFTDDGATLLLSVQHPGEQGGTRVSSRPDESVVVEIRGHGGEVIKQNRTVPKGSNFPSSKLGTPPRSCVVSITRASKRGGDESEGA